MGPSFSADLTTNRTLTPTGDSAFRAGPRPAPSTSSTTTLEPDCAGSRRPRVARSVRPVVVQSLLGLSPRALRAAVDAGRLRVDVDGWVYEDSLRDFIAGVAL